MRLLDEAERTGAELVGCQGVRIVVDEGEALTYTWPRDVNAALAVRPTRNALHHPSSRASRDLVMRLGGFASGLRFGGDTEFCAARSTPPASSTARRSAISIGTGPAR